MGDGCVKHTCNSACAENLTTFRLVNDIVCESDGGVGEYYRLSLGAVEYNGLRSGCCVSVKGLGIYGKSSTECCGDGGSSENLAACGLVNNVICVNVGSVNRIDGYIFSTESVGFPATGVAVLFRNLRLGYLIGLNGEFHGCNRYVAVFEGYGIFYCSVNGINGHVFGAERVFGPFCSVSGLLGDLGRIDLVILNGEVKGINGFVVRSEGYGILYRNVNEVDAYASKRIKSYAL